MLAPRHASGSTMSLSVRTLSWEDTEIDLGRELLHLLQLPLVNWQQDELM